MIRRRTNNNRPVNAIPVGESTFIVPPKEIPMCRQDRMYWVKQDYILHISTGFSDKKSAFDYAENLENSSKNSIL